MPDGGALETGLILALVSTAASVAVSQITKPKMPGIPSPGPQPLPIPTANQAQADAASTIAKAQQRRTLDSLRIDPLSRNTGLQIPSS